MEQRRRRRRQHQRPVVWIVRICKLTTVLGFRHVGVWKNERSVEKHATLMCKMDVFDLDRFAELLFDWSSGTWMFLVTDGYLSIWILWNKEPVLLVNDLYCIYRFEVNRSDPPSPISVFLVDECVLYEKQLTTTTSTWFAIMADSVMVNCFLWRNFWWNSKNDSSWKRRLWCRRMSKMVVFFLWTSGLVVVPGWLCW